MPKSKSTFSLYPLSQICPSPKSQDQGRLQIVSISLDDVIASMTRLDSAIQDASANRNYEGGFETERTSQLFCKSQLSPSFSSSFLLFVVLTLKSMISQKNFDLFIYLFIGDVYLLRWCRLQLMSQLLPTPPSV